MKTKCQSSFFSEESFLCFQSTTNKNFTGQLYFLLFEGFPNEHFRRSSLSVKSALSSFMIQTVPSIASWGLQDKDWGYVLRSEPQISRLVLTFMDAILHCQSAIKDGSKREKLVCIHNIGVCLCVVVVVFSVALKRKKVHVQIFSPFR